ncbi:MAG: hypothetical protein JW807_00800 [Spirochaetes bacterium]|nr:hypothetical protein [Spirochaetota bacterium]
MGVIITFIILAALVLLVIGLKNPDKAFLPKFQKTRRNIALVYGSIIFVCFVILGMMADAGFSVEKNCEDITLEEKVTFTGTGSDDAKMTINEKPYEIKGEKFEYTFPLVMGRNNFLFKYTKNGKDKNELESIVRTTKENLAKELKAEERRKEELAKLEAKQKEAEKRIENIRKQFSAYDGSHYGLESYIKKVMNDPSSYEHVKTGFVDMGDYLVVTTVFRGKNAFGGLVMNSIKAKVSLNGDVLQILSQN